MLTNFEEWAQLAGMRCVCPSGCTGVRWGDAGICVRGCDPCRRMKGKTYEPPPGKGGTRKGKK